MKRCLNCMEIYDEQYGVCPHCGYYGEDQDVPFALSPGTVLNSRYIVGTVIGHGGFGITYRGWDTVLSTKIAIKEYYPTGFATRSPGFTNIYVSGRDEEMYRKGMDRFLQEARTVAAFNRESSIVHVYDYLKENDTAYMIMEYIDGMPLKKYVEQHDGNRLPYEEVTGIALKVLKALSVVHKAGVVHGDISPDNIMMMGNDIILLDFGAARHAVADSDKEMSIILKKEYAPPEQFTSRGRQDGRTDIYALGVIMYRLLTGVLPADSLSRTSGDIVPPPSEYAPYPQWLDDAVMKAMSLDMDDRYDDVEKFSLALSLPPADSGITPTAPGDRSAENSTVSSAQPEQRPSAGSEYSAVPEKKKKPAVRIILIAAILIAVALAAFGIYSSHRNVATSDTSDPDRIYEGYYRIDMPDGYTYDTEYDGHFTKDTETGFVSLYVNMVPGTAAETRDLFAEDKGITYGKKTLNGRTWLTAYNRENSDYQFYATVKNGQDAHTVSLSFHIYGSDTDMEEMIDIVEGFELEDDPVKKHIKYTGYSY